MGIIIKNPDDLALTAYGLKKLGHYIVQASGCFDYFHYGHLRYLQGAKQIVEGLPASLFVTINSDASIKKIKGDNRPFVCQQYRAEILAALSCVDFVYIFDEDLPSESIKRIRPLVYVKGADYEGKHLPEQELVIRNGGEIVFLKTMFDSSTKMMQALERYVSCEGEVK